MTVNSQQENTIRMVTTANSNRRTLHMVIMTNSNRRTLHMVITTNSNRRTLHMVTTANSNRRTLHGVVTTNSVQQENTTHGNHYQPPFFFSLLYWNSCWWESSCDTAWCPLVTVGIWIIFLLSHSFCWLVTSGKSGQCLCVHNDLFSSSTSINTL